MAHPVFKTGRAGQPPAWKVRFLRRVVAGSERCDRIRGYDRILASVTTSQSGLAADDDPRFNRALFTLRESAAYLDVPFSTCSSGHVPGEPSPF